MNYKRWKNYKDKKTLKEHCGQLATDLAGLLGAVDVFSAHLQGGPFKRSNVALVKELFGFYHGCSSEAG